MPNEWAPIRSFPDADNSREGPSGYFLATLKPVSSSMGLSGNAEVSVEGPYLVWGAGLTHLGSGDEVWELPRAPMQNGFLDPFHVQEQGSFHGSGWRRTPSPG